MTRTPSTMLEIGTEAPEFSLADPSTGKVISLDDFAKKPLLIVFSCNHCPYVLHILDSFTDFANQAINQDIGVVMVNSNDVENYSADSPAKMIELGERQGFQFPYLYDESQQVAIAYEAACTPDFFLFDSSHQLVYRGQYDASRPGSAEAVTGESLKNALTALLEHRPIQTTQVPSVGCNIKWRKGNEPAYF
jgi:peroxiredoxin